MWLGENKVGETQPFRVETSTRAAGASLGPVHEREIEEETAKPTDASSADRSKD